ncbi:DENN domain-containing protein 1B [Folsomia candida]|uniref:DENN domain-containing protein 1B n=1 Tax=Folsomia candida TaxID=158441 RepID=A0A226EJV8_FOLCA|nr:DENN domain-containing protein 1B [Folsomia candida]OXA57993.1 DENN domain-containing protein 1B [Folsomia candida]
MGSRIRDRKTVKRIFECYIVIEPPWAEGSSSEPGGQNGGSVTNGGRRSPGLSDGGTPIIKSVFPANYNHPNILKSAAQFAFPCPTNSGTVELFTYVLTGEDSKWTFGYCRHHNGSQSGVVFLTFLPWQEIFYRLLNYCAEIDEVKVVAFLDRLYTIPVPESGTCLYVPTSSKPFICPVALSSDLSLPSIPENRNVSEFYNALGTESMLVLFTALLSERRIVITSKKLSRLSSIVMACNLFLFPFCWQHIFIPVLPMQLSDYLSAPMPFLIGVPIFVWDRLPPESLGQLVRVDADSDTVTSPFPEDLDSLPHDVGSLLRKNLTGERVLGDGLARAFLRSLAQVMGHYQEAIRDDDQSFDSELFVQFAHPSHRQFITTKLLRLQIFQQFIEDRLLKIRAGECESDEFELEALGWRATRTNGRNGFPVFKSISGSQNRTAIKKAGKAVIMSVKRESGNIIESVKQNSALKSALRQVKEGGKSVKQKSHIAVSDIKSKFHVPSSSRNPGSTDSTSHNDQGSKMYARYPNSMRAIQSEKALDPSKSMHMLGDTRDDNLLHLMSFSSSASTMTDLSKNAESDKIKVKPRLSRSEENLIDLDCPTGLGFTLENPLYDLVSNNSVFEDSKTDAQLLLEYGLSDYFNQMNLTSDSDANDNKRTTSDNFELEFGASQNSTTRNSTTSSSSQKRLSTNMMGGQPSSSSSWATFD